MKLRVYDKPKESDVLRLALKQEGDNVVLIVVDEDGKELDYGRILKIRTDGVEFCEMLSHRLGLRINPQSSTIAVYRG